MSGRVVRLVGIHSFGRDFRVLLDTSNRFERTVHRSALSHCLYPLKFNEGGRTAGAGLPQYSLCPVTTVIAPAPLASLEGSICLPISYQLCLHHPYALVS